MLQDKPDDESFEVVEKISLSPQLEFSMQMMLNNADSIKDLESCREALKDVIVYCYALRQMTITALEKWGT